MKRKTLQTVFTICLVLFLFINYALWVLVSKHYVGGDLSLPITIGIFSSILMTTAIILNKEWTNLT